MTETGHGVQVVDVNSDHSYFLNDEGLKGILLRDDIKNLPVVVVSLAGAFRGGKSFMLNYFLRYLNSPVSAREDGSWLGSDNEPLQGFSWRGGSTRNTTGILLWSEPILTSLASGEKVAVLLMDTQGTFDKKSTVRDCSTIFALSTLISSVQIYNLPGGSIQEDDLQHLQLFTEYGKLINEQKDGGKAFQVLEFLVRDWASDFEYPYGSVGGQQYLDAELKIVPDQPKELSDLRRHIIASFETVSCFLMPHPGLKVRRPTFTGSIKEIDPEFTECLKELTSSIFGPRKLKLKMINGQATTASQLYTYFKSYMSIFNSNKIPTPTSIMNATAAAGLLVAANISRDQYQAAMTAACGDAVPSLPAADIKELHDLELNRARAVFISTKKMGSKEDAERHLHKLTEDIDKQLPQYMAINMQKTQKAIVEANEAYDKIILNISSDNALCVHPISLQQVHSDAVTAAVAVFDTKRKRSHGKDGERESFIKSFEQRFKLLRLQNEQNNKMAVSDLRGSYWEQMMSKPPLSAADFQREHEQALAKALDGFKKKRNRPDSFSEDVYKTNLKEAIKSAFDTIKLINQSNNKMAIQAALTAYSEYMGSVKPGKDRCLHPDDLILEHESARCRALLAFRPRKTCEEGYDPSDEDEKTLSGTLQQRYSEAKDINDTANETAVQLALNRYVALMDEVARPNLWWLLIIPIVTYFANKDSYHSDSKQKAMDLFYSKRERRGYHGSDSYRDNLISLIEVAFKEYP